MHRGAFSDINSTSLGNVHLGHGDGDDADDDDDDDDDDYEDLYSLFTSGTTMMMAMMRMMMMMIGIIHLGHNHFQVDQPTCFVDRAHLLIQKDHMFGINNEYVWYQR